MGVGGLDRRVSHLSSSSSFSPLVKNKRAEILSCFSLTSAGLLVFAFVRRGT